MVLLPLRSASGIDEWVTFELQGEIECFNQDKQGDVFKIGTVGLSSTKKDTVEMIIGYHQLEGKIVVLNKPLAMLEKCCTGVGEEQKFEYQVVGIIRRKIIFKSRPKALISKPAIRK